MGCCSYFLLLLVLAKESLSQANYTKEYIIENFLDYTTKLKRDLLANYDRQVPAVYTEYGDEPLKTSYVNVTLMYCKVLSINQAQQLALMVLDFWYEWKDPRLRWDPQQYLGLQSINIGKKETIWIADVLPFDTHTFNDVIPEDQQLLQIDYDGTVRFYRSSAIEFICRMELNDFPFDVQTCSLPMISNNFAASEFYVTGIVSNSQKTEKGNGEWSVLNITVSNESQYDVSSYYITLARFDFVLKRSTTYYVVLMILPSFVLTLLSALGMFWNPLDEEHFMDGLNLGLTAILALVFILQMVTSDMPKINGMNKLSIFLMVNLVLITVASVLVISLGKVFSRRGAKEKPSRFQIVLECLKDRLNWVLLAVFWSAAIINFIVLFS